MKAVKAIYENGSVKLSESPGEQGPVEVLVVFPELKDDSWTSILNETTARPSFLEYVRQCEEQIRQGVAAPLNAGDL
jgi:hypothetical protein